MFQKIFPKGWRTYILTILYGLPAIYQAALEVAQEFLPISQQYDLVKYVPEEWLPLYTLGMVVLTLYLRTITTTPVGKKY